MLSLLKASLLTGDQVEIEDWESVFAEMKRQTVAALPGEWLKSHPIPGASSWSNYCLLQHGQWVKAMYGQGQLLELLDKHDIPCVILKGAAASMAYPQPSLRTTGDVDFLVKRADFEKAATLLEANGYAVSHEKNEESHHYAYSKDGVSYELHRRLGSLEETDEELIRIYEKGIDNRVIGAAGSYAFPVFDSALNGMVLISHIYQHLSRIGLGLRQIIDWMMYVNALPGEVWEDELLPMLQKTGMERLALTVTAMCQKYLGLRTIVEDSEQYPCDELMACVLEIGNFGNKVRETRLMGKTADFTLSSMGKGVFWRLQKGGMIEWPAAKKHRALWPFAWIYQAFRILRMLMNSGMKPRDLVGQTKRSADRVTLLRSLGLEAYGRVHAREAVDSTE